MRYIIFALFLSVSISTFSQVLPDVIFRNLREVAILVRLSTKTNTINAIKDRDPELVKRIEHEQAIRNREIVSAFSKSFTFCAVYYFYDIDGKDIVEKDFKGKLFNSKLEQVDVLPNLNDNYLIANFGATKENKETIEYDNVKYYGRNSEGKLYGEDVKVQYSTDMEGGVDALSLFLPNFIELQSPYPYYVRTFERLPFIARSKEETVALLQHKIEKYLNK